MKKQGTLLVVDDNKSILTTVKMLMESTFETIETLSNPTAIPTLLRNKKPDVVLLDMNFNSTINNGNEGLYWLREIKKLRPQTQVVLFTAYADIDLAVQGIKDGAADFIVKPWDNAKMTETLSDAYNKTKPQGKDKRTAKPATTKMFWGESEAMNKLRMVVEKVATTDANILITGENGTGKEMLANEIHRLSNRAEAVMIPIDMGTITETLFESELFGHEKGAFTDAHTEKKGKFEVAEGGTLFLDEIGNLSYTLQAKLLTALQRRSITRVGGTREIPINVRLICATNRDLQAMVAKGEFREDLLYRINTIHVHIPALRERREDIVSLAELFIGKYSTIYNKPPMTLDIKAKEKLTNQPWAGNIRELEHTIEKTLILCDGSEIKADDIECAPTRTVQTAEKATTLEEMESQMIAKTIEECDGNLSIVATRLGISRQTLYNKIKRYGL